MGSSHHPPSPGRSFLLHSSGIIDSHSQHGCFATIGCGVANRKAGGIIDSHSQLGCFGACSQRQCNKWTAMALALQAGVGVSVSGVVAKRKAGGIVDSRINNYGRSWRTNDA